MPILPEIPGSPGMAGAETPRPVRDGGWGKPHKSFLRWETRLEFRGLTSGDPGLGTITDPNAPGFNPGLT